jgi:hypothetical protein
MPSRLACSFQVVQRSYGQSRPIFSRNFSIPAELSRPKAGASLSPAVSASVSASVSVARSTLVVTPPLPRSK